MFTENDFWASLEAQVYWEEYALLGASGVFGEEFANGDGPQE